MPHTNEGTLHALLDGELPPEEQREVELHLEECPECARRRDEARQFLVGADLLLEGLDHAGAAGPGPQPDAVPVGDAEKLILFPFPPENVRQPPRRFPWAALAWVASIALAVGAGYVVSQNRGGDDDQISGQSTAVVSEMERQGATPPATAVPADTAPAFTPPAVDTAFAELTPDSEFDSTADETELAQAPPPQTTRREPVRTEPKPTPRQQQRQPESPPPAPVVQTNPEPSNPDTETAAEPPAASSPEANLERRSGIYLRIGLDEARRMLGSPLHVIDGLRPQFIGMVAAGRTPGADPARPAIRVVYLDAAQRMILLDQQRLPIGDSGRDRPRQPTITNGPSGPVAGWVKGDVWLALHGISADALQDLAGRVR